MTGMKVNGENNWIWVFVTMTAYSSSSGRAGGAKVLREVLDDYDGTIVCAGPQEENEIKKESTQRKDGVIRKIISTCGMRRGLTF